MKFTQFCLNLKSRVVYQQTGERNFHSFYYLVYGAPEADMNEYALKSSMINQYNYLNQSGSASNQMNDDKSNFRLVNDAMRISNFEPELIKTIWSIVAAVIHLGNLKFESNEKDLNNNTNSRATSPEKDDGSGGHTRVCEESMHEIKIVSKLLKLDESELIKALTSRLIASGSKELVTTFHSVKEAAYARDALSKVIT